MSGQDFRIQCETTPGIATAETAGWKSLYILTGVLTMFSSWPLTNFATCSQHLTIIHHPSIRGLRYIVQPQIGYFGYVSVPVLASNISKLES